MGRLEARVAIVTGGGRGMVGRSPRPTRPRRVFIVGATPTDPATAEAIRGSADRSAGSWRCG
jgi:hypothetical protein